MASSYQEDPRMWRQKSLPLNAPQLQARVEYDTYVCKASSRWHMMHMIA